MAITHVNTTTVQNGTGSTTLDVPKPVGMQDNDVVFVSVVLNTSSGTVNPPSGFNNIGNMADATEGTYSIAFWKHVQTAASEPATYSFAITNSKGAAVASAYRNVDYNSPVYRSAFEITNSDSYQPPNLIDYPYTGALGGTVLVYAACSDAGSFNFTGGNIDVNTATITEVGDVTSSGGGAGTTKVTLAAAYIPDPYIFDIGTQGVTDFYGANYRVNTDGGSVFRVIRSSVGIRAIDAPVIGPATDFNSTFTFSEIRSQPVQWTDGKWTARSTSTGGEAIHIANPDTVYEVLGQDKMVGIFAEYDTRVTDREQEGRAVVFSPLSNDYSTWGESEGETVWQGQYYGSGCIDTVRLSDNKFAVLWSMGHAYGQTGSTGSTWVDDSYFKVLRVDGTTVTTEVSYTVAPDSSYLGNIVSDEQNSLIFTGYINTTTPSFGARIIHYNGSAWSMGAQYSYASDGRSALYSTAAAHIAEQKAVFFYSDSTLNAYVARVGNITADGNGRPTVITYGTEYSVPNTTSSSTYAAVCKPIVLSATEGLLLIKQTNSTIDLCLVKYTIGVGDVITFDTPVVVWSDTGALHSKQGLAAMLYHQGKIIVAYTTYTNVSPNYTSRLAVFDYDGSITPVSDEEIQPASTSYKVSNPTLSAGSGPYFHLNYFDLTSNSRLPLLQTFSIPSTQMETDQTNDLSAYIPVNEPNPLNSGAQLAFINSEGIYGSIGAYIGAPATPVSHTTPARGFIWGQANLSESLLAYINYNDQNESTQHCFIQAGVEEASLNAFISGPDIITSSTELFVHGYDSTSNTLYGYIEGTEIFTANNVGAVRLQKSLSQRIEFDDNLNIRPTQEVTVNFWMKAYDLSDGSRPGFLIKDYGSSRSIGIFEGANGTRKWHYGVDTTTGWSASDTVGNWVADTWYMVTLRYNGSTVAFFVNGQLDSSFAKTGDINWDTGTWNVGYRPNTGEYTNMAFSRFDLWNYALTDQEIEDLFGYGTYTTVGAFIDGDEPEILDDSVWSYIVSIESNANPFNISSGQMALIPYDGVIDSQSCYLVGPPLHVVNHDLKIVLDNFEYARHDLVMRVNGQGETVLTKITGAIEYPITREASVYLGKLFFSDMPGVEYNSQSCFLVGGINLDHTTEMRVFIQSQSYGVNFLQSYVHGDFTALNASKADCFIVCDQINEYMSAYIVNDQADVTGEMYLYIAAPIYSVDGDAPSFIHGWDQFTSGPARAYVHTIDAMSGFAQMFITAGEVLSKDTPTGQYVFIPANAQVFDPAQNCYVYGAYVELGSQNCFLMAQPTVETPDVDCYIEAPYPFVPVQEMLMWTHGNEPLSDSTLCYVQGNPNIISDSSSDMGSFIWGWVIVDVRQLLYIQNIQIFPASPLKQNLYIASAVESTGTIGCFIAGQQETGYVRAYITNSDSSANMSVSKKCYIVGQGDTSPILSAFVSGRLVIQTDLNNPFLPTYIVG